jgi:formate hydrogenlyase subunit 4
MQRRVGPPIIQPFYDVGKLFSKRAILVQSSQIFYVLGFVVFMAVSGMIFFSGGDMLLTVFAFTLAGVFLALGAYVPATPYSDIGAERELLQMMAYEPMLLIAVLGLYAAGGSFRVDQLISLKSPLLFQLPAIFVGFLFVLTIKLRKSPFDLSTSHHAHQELVKGVTTEFSGPSLGLIEIGHWYENIILLGMVFVFFAGWNVVLAVLLTIVTYIVEIVIDNVYARLTWKRTLKAAWAVALILGALNLTAVYYLRACV